MTQTIAHSGGESDVCEEFGQGKSVEFTVILCMYSFIGIIGNIIILVVYCREKSKLFHGAYICTLAVVDFIVCCAIIPYTIAYERRLVTSDVICRGMELLRHILVMVSNGMLLAIAVDRYLSVFKPWRVRTRRKNLIAILAIFVGSTIASAPAITVFTVTKGSSDVTSLNASNPIKGMKPCARQAYCQFYTAAFGETWALSYQCLLALEYVVTAIAVIVLYIKVYRYIWERDRWRKRLTSHGSNSPQNSSHMEQHCSNLERSCSSKNRRAWRTTGSAVFPLILGRRSSEAYNEKQVDWPGDCSSTQHTRVGKSGKELSMLQSALVGTARNAGRMFLTVPSRACRKLKSAGVAKDQQDEAMPHKHPVRIVIHPAPEAERPKSPAVCASKDTKQISDNNNSIILNNIALNVNAESCREKEGTRHDSRRKAGTMLFICTLIYILTWLPFWIDIFGATNNLLFRYTFLLAHATNPLVYGIVNTKVRDEMKRLFMCQSTQS